MVLIKNELLLNLLLLLLLLALLLLLLCRKAFLLLLVLLLVLEWVCPNRSLGSDTSHPKSCRNMNHRGIIVANLLRKNALQLMDTLA
jgi:hypothetical protein